jgi:anti-anti-sigma regulatory factor
MLKIERLARGEFVVFSLSGRLEVDDVAELQRLFAAEDHKVIMNLKEVALVDRDAVRFLARCEADRWIVGEKGPKDRRLSGK